MSPSGTSSLRPATASARKLLYAQALDLLLDHAPQYALDAGRSLADLLEAEGDTSGALARPEERDSQRVARAAPPLI